VGPKKKIENKWTFTSIIKDKSGHARAEKGERKKNRKKERRKKRKGKEKGRERFYATFHGASPS